MISVMILEDAYKIDHESCNQFNGVYIPLLISLLRSKEIKCESVKIKGLERMYSVLGKSKENLLYVPKTEISKNGAEEISFIYVDSAASVSTSFKIASIIRNLRSERNNKNVVFIEQLKDEENLKNCSPIIVDNIRLSEKFNIDLYETAYISASTATDGICRFYGL